MDKTRPHGSILFLFLLFLLFHPSTTTAQTGPDNRYCNPGNIPNFGTSDGPANLPTACFYTALSATPSPGNVITVVAGGNLQGAINQAQCGDTIALQPGASFVSSLAGFVLPANHCDDNHWITIRTHAPNSSLPPEGSRMTPCYSGVTTLPGRPPFACPSSQVVTAKVLNNAHAPAVFVFAPNANHYRFLGLEITRSPTGGAGSLVKINNATSIIFDRIWIHGVPNNDTESAIGLSPGSSYIALIDSYANDFHCEAITGTCTDSHVVYGGLGDSGGGPYKIVDDFIESAAEGTEFGGGEATTTPTDIEVRRNHYFKPLTWEPGNPNLITGPHNHPFIVKNNFELKNADRVLVEGNLMENVWGGFSQWGYQIVLTPKSQNNKCPLCFVANVTVRYNQISHSGAGLTVADSVSDAGGAAQGVENISIHDDVLDDVNASKYAGAGGVIGLSSIPIMFWQNIAINHITSASQNDILLVVGSTKPSPMTNVTFTNSILVVGEYQITGTGAGGEDNCAYQLPNPAEIFSACWTNYTVLDNLIVDGSRNTWPPSQTFTTLHQVGFVSYDEGDGGDYQLCEGVHNPAPSCAAASPYLTDATIDGKTVGADIVVLNEELAGID